MLQALLPRGRAPVRRQRDAARRGQPGRVATSDACATTASPARRGRCSSCRPPGAPTAAAATCTIRTTRSSARRASSPPPARARDEAGALYRYNPSRAVRHGRLALRAPDAPRPARVLRASTRAAPAGSRFRPRPAGTRMPVAHEGATAMHGGDPSRSLRSGAALLCACARARLRAGRRTRSRRRRARPAPSTHGRRPTSTASAPPHQLGEQRVVHAAAGLAERGLLPRPQHARLPRAAVRGHRRQARSSTARRSTTTRATSSRSPAGSPRASSRSHGSLGFRQVTERTRWRLTKTWITDPGARDGARARPVRVAHRQAAEALRARRPGAGRRRQRRPRRPSPARRSSIAFDDAAASAVAATPALQATTQRLPRQRERSVEATSQDDKQLERLRRDRARQRRPGRADARSTAARQAGR